MEEAPPPSEGRVLRRNVGALLVSLSLALGHALGVSETFGSMGDIASHEPQTYYFYLFELGVWVFHPVFETCFCLEFSPYGFVGVLYRAGRI